MDQDPKDQESKVQKKEEKLIEGNSKSARRRAKRKVRVSRLQAKKNKGALGVVIKEGLMGNQEENLANSITESKQGGKGKEIFQEG